MTHTLFYLDRISKEKENKKNAILIYYDEKDRDKLQGLITLAEKTIDQKIQFAGSHGNSGYWSDPTMVFTQRKNEYTQDYAAFLKVRSDGAGTWLEIVHSDNLPENYIKHFRYNDEDLSRMHAVIIEIFQKNVIDRQKEDEEEGRKESLNLIYKTCLVK